MTAVGTSGALGLGVLYWLLVLVIVDWGHWCCSAWPYPAITLVLGAMVIWGLVVGFKSIGLALGVAVVALILSFAIDYLAGVLGAQRSRGASRWGQIGAIIGMFFGALWAIAVLAHGHFLCWVWCWVPS